MALRLDTPTEYGVSAGYARVESLQLNYTNRTAVARMALYKDAATAARPDGRPLRWEEFHWGPDAFPFPDADGNGKVPHPTRTAYLKIKEPRPGPDGQETNRWAGAEDV